MNFRNMAHGFKGFRMEALGVMFFGAGLQKFFGGLLEPAGKLVGIFDLLNTTLGLVFLPIMLKMQAAFLPLMMFLISLPEPVKLLIGVFTILGALFGGVLFLVGMFTLGIGALIVMFGSVGAAMGLAAAVFGIFVIAINVVGSVILIAILVWKTKFFGFMEFIGNTFESIKLLLASAWEDFKKGPEGWVSGIVKVFVAMGVGVYNSMVWLVNAVKTLFVDILVGGIMAAIETILAFISNIPGLGFVADWAVGMGEGREAMYDWKPMDYITPEAVSTAFNIKVETDTDVTARTTGESIGG